jgi:hypothetical protein
VATTVYVLCALTSLTCAVLLFRSYLGERLRLVLWTALGFAGLAVNNALLVIDQSVLPDVDLTLLRDVSSFLAVSVLLLGLIWESQ